MTKEMNMKHIVVAIALSIGVATAQACCAGGGGHASGGHSSGGHSSAAHAAAHAEVSHVAEPSVHTATTEHSVPTEPVRRNPSTPWYMFWRGGSPVHSCDSSDKDCKKK